MSNTEKPELTEIQKKAQEMFENYNKRMSIQREGAFLKMLKDKYLLVDSPKIIEIIKKNIDKVQFADDQLKEKISFLKTDLSMNIIIDSLNEYLKPKDSE